MSIPCPMCKGRGKVYDPKDRDVIEGYKLAIRYLCLFCKGEGDIKSNDIRLPAIKVYIEKMKTIEKSKEAKRQKEINEREKLVKSIKSKLTPEELKLITNMLL